jgi:hypothetical protein
MYSIRALIVDDSSVMRKIVERSLRQAGGELSKVFEAGNGAEGLAVLAENRVELILCDINMPVMDGLEFVWPSQASRTPGNTRSRDYNRGERSARGTGPVPGGAGLHPQAVYAGSGQGTGDSSGGRESMKNAW